MTFIVKCDGCGKTEESPVNAIGTPYNPDGWRSRVMNEIAPYKTVHACSDSCLEDCVRKYGGIVGPF